MDFDSICLHTEPRWFHCEPAWHWAPPPLTNFALWFVAAGRGELRLEGESFELSSGLCFVVRPGARPLGTHQPRHPLVVFSCRFSPLSAPPVSAQKMPENCWPEALRVRDTGFFLACAHRAETLWRRGDDFARLQAQCCIEAMLRQLQDEAMQGTPSSLDVALEDLAAQIRREPGEKWVLDAMAGRVHLSRAQFVRRFRARFGQSPARFVIDVRLERARQLLRETNLSLEQIALALGYGNAPFFARQFKQFCDQTPGKWRAGSD